MKNFTKAEWIEKRAQAIILKQEDYFCREIANKFKISRSTVSDAVRRYAETDKNCDRKRSGRPKITSKREDNYIVNKSKRNRRLTAREITQEINKTRKHPISITTIKRRLKDQNMNGRVAAKKITTPSSK